MKIRKINILLALTIGAFVTLGGCKKDDGPIPSRVTVDAVPAVSCNVDATTTNVSLAAITAFSGKFTVSMYFAGATPPSKIDLVIRKNSSSTAINNNTVKLYKANAVTAYPMTFTITYAELSALFGTTFVLNQVYDIGLDLYLGDKKYEAFPLGITGTGAGVAAMPLFGEYARFTIKP